MCPFILLCVPQENRAFDHYYGLMKGVRGFNDRASPAQPGGQSIFAQPVRNAAKETVTLLPFPLHFNTSSATCMPAPAMDYATDIGIWNQGRMDAWNTARDPGFGMSYFSRSDLPYYYALGDAFTLGDQYFQSTFTATNPNRLHLFSGSNGLSVNSSFDLLDDTEPLEGVDWTTMAETLMAAKISWKVYQQLDNFDDNAFAWFRNFKKAMPGSPLFDHGMARSMDVVAEFARDVVDGKLPAVSWIVGPTAWSEHAENHPQDGEDLSARLIKVLQDNPAVYSKTVFILNYDEGGQFFDHHWPPTPPASEADGASTVTTDGELTRVSQFNIPAGHPIGLGFRVPLFIISPWTRGPQGLVFSQVSDHTSVIKFIEKRWPQVHCPNISPWRRAVVSDLVNAFDWDHPDHSWPVFPKTSQNENQSKAECSNLPMPVLPIRQFMPTQEPGTKPSRSLPYIFHVTATVSTADHSVTMTITNAGTAGAAFLVVDHTNFSSTPRKYTVEAGKSLQGVWTTVNGLYNVTCYGPNGYVRHLAGTDSTTGAALAASLSYQEANESVTVQTQGPAGCAFLLTDMAYNLGGPWTLHSSTEHELNLSATGHWYDLIISATCPGVSSEAFTRRFMGRMETGVVTVTDPAMAQPPQLPVTAPDTPTWWRDSVRPWQTQKNCQSRRSRLKDACWDWELQKNDHHGIWVGQE